MAFDNEWSYILSKRIGRRTPLMNEGYIYLNTVTTNSFIADKVEKGFVWHDVAT